MPPSTVHEQERRDAPVILVVDDDPGTRELLEGYLTAEDYQVWTAADGEAAWTQATATTPDLILLDLKLPGISGYELCARLKAHEPTAAIPILVITALDPRQALERALQAGADDVLTKPIRRPDLLTRVQALLKVRHLTQELDRAVGYLQELQAAQAAASRPEARPPQAAPQPDAATPVILVIDDEPFIRHFCADLLRSNGYQVETAATAQEGLQQVEACRPDVILLDIMMPGGSGLDLLPTLQTAAPGVPVIMATAYGSAHNAILALQRGAFDFIVKGFKPEVLLHAVKRAVEKRRLEQENMRLLEELKAKSEKLWTLKQRDIFFR